jgi:hypothetical protein
MAAGPNIKPAESRRHPAAAINEEVRSPSITFIAYISG